MVHWPDQRLLNVVLQDRSYAVWHGVGYKVSKLTWSDLTFDPINLWNAPHMTPKKPKDNIRGITGQAALDYMAQLRKIDKMKPVQISIQDYSWK